ncbi:hypothetical protein ACS6JN_25010 [Enterobacter hormaechei subsp. steigerwaltii]|uniref:hypothetical protein n=1 Tax=Enterobacter hormaechei TaxID=158836 RepID=UPI003F429CE1
MGSAATDIILESKRSRKKNKRPVHGVGIIDVPFSVRGTVDGKKIYHRAFKVWNSILQRCYYPPIQAKYPSYIGCSVSPEWLLFSGFLTWWKANFHEGWEIDKDLLFPGNKIYSPDKCLFVPCDLNSFVISREAKRGPSPIGSTFDARYGVYRTTISLGKGQKHYLGSFACPDEAYAAWLSAKLKLAERFKPICDEIHPQLYDSLLTKIRLIK